MKRLYRVPIMGTVRSITPLQGDATNPLCIIPISELPGFDNLAAEDRSFAHTNLKYNVDEGWCDIELTASEAFHEWLVDLLPELKNIQNTKEWKLDR